MSTPLFSFAVISDTHIRPADGDDTSPFPVNDLANPRARYAAAAIAQYKPRFTVHLGDMVHPLPDMATYGAACEEALAIFSPLRPNLHYVPGNHDIGDKPHKGTPAGTITPDNIATYEEFFGPTWYSFDHDNCHIVVMNSSLVNSGTEIEARQREWLEEDLQSNRHKRSFVFSHYPPFIQSPDEPTHFDNYAQPGRRWFLQLAAETKVEAVLSGHVHNFFYARHGGTKYHVVPSTCFVRQDYTEMYHAPPDSEFGRNDRGKFAFAIVDIYPDQHVLRVISTEGRELGGGEDLLERFPDQCEIARPIGHDVAITVPLRHPWAASTELSFNGPFEEFTRKRVRNDYTLMRLQQMGTMRVRVPIADLMDKDVCTRMADYHAAGCSFTLCCVGVPDAEEWEACRQSASMIDAVELITSTLDLSDLSDELAALTRIEGINLLIGLAHSSVHEKINAKFSHAVSFGYKWERRDEAIASLTSVEQEKLIDGLIFQINLTDDIETLLTNMDAFADQNDIKVSANIRLANENPAIANFDDDAIAERIREVIATARILRHTGVQLDTLLDVDRGYHPRHGLVDQLYNLRPAGRLLAGYQP